MFLSDAELLGEAESVGAKGAGVWDERTGEVVEDGEAEMTDEDVERMIEEEDRAEKRRGDALMASRDSGQRPSIQP